MEPEAILYARMVLEADIKDWIPYYDYTKLPKDDLADLLDKYNVFWIPEYSGFLWLEEKHGGDKRNTQYR